LYKFFFLFFWSSIIIKGEGDLYKEGGKKSYWCLIYPHWQSDPTCCYVSKKGITVEVIIIKWNNLKKSKLVYHL
jgi:hypothetical protein